MVIKMADGCTITDSQSSQTRMTESKGKKNSNNKICVYNFIDAAFRRNISLLLSIQSSWKSNPLRDSSVRFYSYSPH